MSAKYREFQQLNLPAIEEEILAKWSKNQAFEKSVTLREGSTPFVFYEGPPSANGMPGIHHVISRTLKDLVCRYKTMQGFQVRRKAGWDTHGLPIELGVEKMLGITKEDIGKKISVAEYNATCRNEVLKFKDKWDELTTKMGYWVDLKHPYITFKNDYIESLWWSLKQLYSRDLLYESISIQPYSPAAGTGLSSHELNQPGTYKMVKDTSCIAMFRAIENEKSKFLFEAANSREVFFLAWTTTPWTLPSNLGLTVGPNIDYVLVKTFNPYSGKPCAVVLAKPLIHQYFPEKIDEWDEAGNQELFDAITNWLTRGSDEVLIGDHNPKLKSEFDHLIKKKQLPYKIVKEFRGRQLEECRYEQLLPFDANSPDKSGGDPFRVLLGDFVTTEDGTGIVHTAPAFGADDYKVGKKYGIGILVMVDKTGKFVDGLGEFAGRYVKNYKDDPEYVDVNVDICVKLKKENRAFKIEKYEHNYPHCWRTDKPVLYYPLDAWFIRTTAYKDRMVELNKTINWKPKSTGEGRFGNWLENMVDWNLSRSRYWGTPLPIWKSDDGSEEKCIGSIDELLDEIEKANKALKLNQSLSRESLDLHKPFVDEVILVSENGNRLKRVPDLIDVWFDSGAMPFAQWHFPFENKETFAKNYPADFIAEGVDQTRGWFYTLHALAALLKESIQEELKNSGIVTEDLDQHYPGLAYKTCVSNGLVLDKNGNKMSKRLGNVVDPFKTIEQFGADATRWYLITNASPWDSLKFDLDGIREVQRKFFGTLYNTYQFFALYANVDGFSFKEEYIALDKRPEIDRWILSSLNSLKKKVTAYLDDYEPTAAGRAIEDFVDEHLSNWYVRLCRRRFWKGEYEQDKICAYQTLYECLETVAQLMAPISPFFSDVLFTNLNSVSGRNKLESVHHALFPVADAKVINTSLEERMQMAQDISSLVLSLRKKVNIKVRQPLQKVLIPVLDYEKKKQMERVEDLIKSEVNVKHIEYLTEDTGFIKKKAKANFVALGKKLGPKMKAAAAAIANLGQDEIIELEKNGFINLNIQGEGIVISRNEVEVQSEDIPGWIVANQGELTVALDVTVTPDLEQEGNARELVNRIQKIRKDSGFELTDRILVRVAENASLKPSITQFNDYICAEILADSLELVPEIVDGTEIEVNDIPLKVFVTKKA
ncbi:MAG: isoleucine--tRNA ligase [Bacteroidetes bacterium]|nr:MAG: isoleucine--tRNA ligase [Bacteroidota bacterium]